MESLEDRPSAPNAERPVKDAPDGGKVSRIALDSFEQLVEGFRDWTTSRGLL